MNGYVQRDLSTVRPGDFVLAPDGSAWKVLGRMPSRQVILTNQAGTQTTAPASGPAQVWDGDMQQAISVMQQTLGARVVADSSLTR